MQAEKRARQPGQQRLCSRKPPGLNTIENMLCMPSSSFARYDQATAAGGLRGKVQAGKQQRKPVEEPGRQATPTDPDLLQQFQRIPQHHQFAPQVRAYHLYLKPDRLKMLPPLLCRPEIEVGKLVVAPGGISLYRQG